MSSRILRRIIPAAFAAALPATALALSAVPAASAASAPGKTVTAVTKITARPDSGDYGDWANDSFTRIAKVTLAGKAAAAKCGGNATCYHWTGVVADMGKFATIRGATSPGNGYLNGGTAPSMGASITGAMAGGIAYDFYTTAKATSAKPPATENDGGKLPKPSSSTGAWVTQFFKSGTLFWDANGNKGTYLATVGGWLYTAAPGADKACPHIASQWLDASPDWGVNASDGNILAPNAAHC